MTSLLFIFVEPPTEPSSDCRTYVLFLLANYPHGGGFAKWDYHRFQSSEGEIPKWQPKALFWSPCYEILMY